MQSLLSQNREAKELKPRALVAALLATLLFSLLAGRLYYLQVLHGTDFERKSQQNYIKEKPRPADRGRILDRRGRVLADNRPSFDVYLTPGTCRKDELVDKVCRQTLEVLDRLALHLNLTPEEVEVVRKAFRAMRSRKDRELELFRPYLVKLDAGEPSRDKVDMLEADKAALVGVDIIPSPHRRYRWGPTLAHVVGYMSEVTQREFEQGKGRYRRGDFIGRRGLERSYEQELRGQDGKVRLVVDSKQRELDETTASALIPPEERYDPGRPGRDLTLTIDVALQAVAEKAVESKARAGSVVVVDVNTGGILALVSYPTYDPNRMTGRITRAELQAIVDDPLEPLFQRAVQQHYHPGSTFKVVTALAGLESGVAGVTSAVSCNGGYSLGARRWRCHKDSGHGGGINLRKSMQVSCDVYYYWLADKLGLDPIASMAKRLGFGRPTGLELGSEAPGIVPTEAFHLKVDKMYTKGFALNAAIGQGSVNVTPLQLALAYAAIANGGVLYKPRLVRRISEAGGALVKELEPEVASRIDLPAAAWNALRDGLTAVVAEPGGTAYSKRLTDVSVAGKTGTAQVVVLGDVRKKETEMEWEERDHAWFAAYAPADEPEIAVVALNEHGGHGGAAAAPIAMAVVQAYFDLKRRELADGTPLTEEAVRTLVPAPRFAAQAWQERKREAEARRQADAFAGPDSSAAEVADPTLLVRRARKAKPVAAVPSDVEARPSPEE